MFDNYREDVRRLVRMSRANGSGPLRALRVCLTGPGSQAIAAYRFAHWLRGQPAWLRALLLPLRALLSSWVQIAWGIELNRAARIGPGLYIGHFGGITVGAHVVAGRNLSLSHGVTIGASGQGERRGSPVIGDDVYIAPGAKVFGPIRIGHNVKIGANAVVHRDVPDHAVIAAPPFEIVSFRGNRPRADTAETQPAARSPVG